MHQLKIRAIRNLAILLLLFPTKILAYSDLSPSHWSYEYVTFVQEFGLVDSTKEFFEPDRNISRAEFMKMVVEASGGVDIPLPSIPTFKDVPKESWFFPYVETAVTHGVIEGYRNSNGQLSGFFGPHDPVTRAAATKILVGNFQIPAYYNPPAPFLDVIENSWYMPYLHTAYNWSIINKHQNIFEPDQAASRAEISQMIFQALTPIDRNLTLPNSTIADPKIESIGQRLQLSSHSPVSFFTKNILGKVREHFLSVAKIDPSLQRIQFNIQPEDIDVWLSVPITKELDLNQNGIFDLKITLHSWDTNTFTLTANDLPDSDCGIPITKLALDFDLLYPTLDPDRDLKIADGERFDLREWCDTQHSQWNGLGTLEAMGDLELRLSEFSAEYVLSGQSTNIESGLIWIPPAGFYSGTIQGYNHQADDHALARLTTQGDNGTQEYEFELIGEANPYIHREFILPAVIQKITLVLSQSGSSFRKIQLEK